MIQAVAAFQHLVTADLPVALLVVASPKAIQALRREPALGWLKNGAKVYPDLATSQASHPGQEIAPFAFPLHEGEFFDVCTL